MELRPTYEKKSPIQPPKMMIAFNELVRIIASDGFGTRPIRSKLNRIILTSVQIEIFAISADLSEHCEFYRMGALAWRSVIPRLLRSFFPEQSISCQDFMPEGTRQAVFLRATLDVDFTIGQQVKPLLSGIAGVAMLWLPRLLDDRDPTRMLGQIKSIVAPGDRLWQTRFGPVSLNVLSRWFTDFHIRTEIFVLRILVASVRPADVFAAGESVAGMIVIEMLGVSSVGLMIFGRQGIFPVSSG